MAFLIAAIVQSMLVAHLQESFPIDYLFIDERGKEYRTISVYDDRINGYKVECLRTGELSCIAASLIRIKT